MLRYCRGTPIFFKGSFLLVEKQTVEYLLPQQLLWKKKRAADRNEQNPTRGLGENEKRVFGHN